MKISRSLWSVSPLAIFVILALAEQKQAWKGTISREGDVVVVHNPKEPLYGPGAFSLKKDLSIGGGDATDYVLGEIAMISTSREGTIFVTDLKEKDVKVFDSNGKFVRIIGKPGQGPGEFTAAPTYLHFLNKNEIFVVNGTKLSVFRTNGIHVRDIAVSTLNLIDAYPASRGNFVATLVVRPESNPRYELRKLDSELKDLFVIDSSPLQNSARDGYNPFFPVMRWSPLSGDRTVSGYPIKYELRIHNSKGRLVRKIERDADRISISKKDIEEQTAGSSPSSLKNMKAPEYFPYFQYVKTDDEDRIYVFTWERATNGMGNWTEIFDSSGRYIVRVSVPGRVPLIEKNYLYSIEETHEGYPVIRRYKVSWQF
jgi:hypothetical protein